MSEQDPQQQDTDRDQAEPRDGRRDDLPQRDGESRGVERPVVQPRDGERQRSETRAPARLIDRRTLLKSGLLAGGALAGGGAALADLAAKQASVFGAQPVGKRSVRTHGADVGVGEQPVAGLSKKTRVPAGRRPPNILVIMVDQLRTPQWFSAGTIAAATMPNITGLANAGVSFANHYTASNDCTPSRAALLTGLYTHQTGCMITGGSTLDPGFPTWGTMLREQDYKTYWYGKWHLTHGDNLWEAQEDAERSSPMALRAAPIPRPTGRPGRAGAWTPTSSPSSNNGLHVRRRPPAAARSRGVRPCRS